MLQLVGGSLVADDDGMWVQLERADCPFLRDSALYGMVQCTCLAMPVAYDEYLPGIHHGAHAHGECSPRHLCGIASEEAAVGYDGVRGQALDAGAAGEGGERLVEGNVPVGTYAAHEQVDAARSLYGSLVCGALSLEVGSIAVEDVYVSRLYVDVAEEVVPHEAVVALGVLFGQAYILVHVERHDVAEADLAGLVQFYQTAVQSKGRRPRGASQLEGLFCCRLGSIYPVCHILGSPSAELLIIRLDYYSHNDYFYLTNVCRSVYTMQVKPRLACITHASGCRHLGIYLAFSPSEP